ncbi:MULTISPECIES: 5'/3'-nucleotidase SurE [Peptoniphilus]|uniref:5'/3'-nucleotidase SurE n=1 Tax=Peptoniphilus TaxID=162289 RepID=UPI0001DAA17C|nr:MULTISPECIES: 5'/3'-nucleotidase SurE [Peptoniphilus]EFI41717.1 putative 5'/3'-nucleotidase SurE [Peptoniphilus sp. oral taxon 386 str. F0131]
MNILLTNDDGFFSAGIRELAKQLIFEGHNITVVAPDVENSGKSHSITLMKELKFNKVEIDGLNCNSYSVSGTPADCVRTALEVLGNDFDYCFSGCNLGYNAGMDIMYSGTVSAAIEANVFGINAIAISAEYDKISADFKSAAKVAVEVFNKLSLGLKTSHVLNINVPKLSYENLNGIKICKVGCSVMDKYTTSKTDDGYILKLHGRNKCINVEGTDRYYLERGFATVTPLIHNLTNENLVNLLGERL